MGQLGFWLSHLPSISKFCQFWTPVSFQNSREPFHRHLSSTSDDCLEDRSDLSCTICVCVFIYLYFYQWWLWWLRYACQNCQWCHDIQSLILDQHCFKITFSRGTISSVNSPCIIYIQRGLFNCPPPKISKCRPVSKFFQKKIEYPDCPPPKISKCQTGKENSDT